MADTKQDLKTILRGLDTFYAQNLGAISNALWTEQEALGFSNVEVVTFIKALAEVKERINVSIDKIIERMDNSGHNPE